jgi:RimJ/RimL family protein N-acetyltransferase
VFTDPLTAEQLREYLQHANQPKQSEVFAYKAIDAVTGATVGHISLAHLNWNDNTGRISRVLVGDPAMRCRGYGQAMVKALLKIGFEKLGLRRISLGVYDFNSPAIRCYQRCGFHHIGTLRHVVRYKDEYWSAVEMSIMQHEWRQTGAETHAA